MLNFINNLKNKEKSEIAGIAIIRPTKDKKIYQKRKMA